MKLNVKALALTCALLWGFGLLLFTWWIILFDGATGDVTFIGRIYRGYNISISGSLFGLLWGLADGAILGAIFAWIYNFFSGRFRSA
ncbi:MAG: bacteriophage holin [Calditrichaceae bacterium]